MPRCQKFRDEKGLSICSFIIIETGILARLSSVTFLLLRFYLFLSLKRRVANTIMAVKQDNNVAVNQLWEYNRVYLLVAQMLNTYSKINSLIVNVLKQKMQKYTIHLL